MNLVQINCLIFFSVAANVLCGRQCVVGVGGGERGGGGSCV